MADQVNVQADRIFTIAMSGAFWVQIIDAVQQAPISWMRAEALRMPLIEQLQQQQPEPSPPRAALNGQRQAPEAGAA